MICTVEGCERDVHARGYCSMHWKRWRKHGDATVVLASVKPRLHDCCTVDGCARPHRARGLCDSHYSTWQRHGDAGREARTVEERWWEKVAITEGCWLWTASLDGNGYGRFHDGERDTKAHRSGYEMLVGPVPDGLELDHLCRVRACVRPDHLEPVTHAENVRRAAAAEVLV